ncbi:MAG: pantetheine-phosphate adenylyltransferase [Bacteriovoracaceae bacterium]|jgi:pantetheine-phosphate adenylyltransferase|nr:pantetheine-phosphate adenylyltransferase [Bacteriovoracaceae bacterium]
MSKKIIVYPISANPPTWGHADIMMRAASHFDMVYWVAAVNPKKTYMFTLEERLEMMQAYVDYYKLDNVKVLAHEGTIVRFAKDKGAGFLLRGLRNSTDYQMELELSVGNRGIEKSIETICMFAKPHYATISSSLIRELVVLNERIDQYVMPSIAKKILKKIHGDKAIKSKNGGE